MPIRRNKKTDAAANENHIKNGELYYKYKTCTRCLVEYKSYARMQLYCPMCRKIVDREIARAARDPKKKRYERVCVVCNNKFMAWQPNQKACSGFCVKAFRYKRTYQRAKFRLATDPAFAITRLTRNRVNELLKLSGVPKTERSLALVGCSIDELRQHLESKFMPDMTWKNRGIHGWHIDHIKPCSSFDLTDPAQLRQCFHYTNLQPLWSRDNLKKSSHWLGPIPEPKPPD